MLEFTLKKQLGLEHQGQLYEAGKNQQVFEACVQREKGIPGRKNMGVGEGGGTRILQG